MFLMFKITFLTLMHYFNCSINLLVVARQLTRNTMGYLSWSGGSTSYMTTTISRNTENYSFMAQLQVKIKHFFAFRSIYSTSTKERVSLVEHSCFVINFQEFNNLLFANTMLSK